MISFLHGLVIPQDEETVIINVRGVGYELYVSTQTLSVISEQSQAQLWVYTHVREDLFQLFGFVSKTEKEFFISLLKVNGIGPKVALKILSGAPLSTIVQMIEDRDVKALSRLPKVGKKTAEQIILQLKGKLVMGDLDRPRGGFSARADITSALVNLGFKIQDVEKVVDQMDPQMDLEGGIKTGLASLAGTF